MTVRWQTPAGNLGIIVERLSTSIRLEATSDVGAITFSLLAGTLPRGLRLSSEVDTDSTQNSIRIIGSPTEVRRFTDSRFVIIDDDGTDIEDRTFSISVGRISLSKTDSIPSVTDFDTTKKGRPIASFIQ